jgi:dolichol-phosphate mannosyltransferase
MQNVKKIAVIIPCHNEEPGIAHVLSNMPHGHLQKLGYELEVIVIDNNSRDATASVSQAHGARVLFESRKGKGNALRTGFRAVSDDAAYVVMLDGDNTYKPHEIPRLIEPLANGFCDVIVGSRLGGKTMKDAFLLKNRIANWFFTFLVRQFYKANVTDVLSGFFAWKKEVIDELVDHLESEGFAIEMEMITKMKRLGHEMYSVPITYDTRAGETKLSAWKDGVRILYALMRYFFWRPVPQTVPALVTLEELPQ